MKLSDIPVVTVSDEEWEQYQPVTIKEPKPMSKYQIRRVIVRTTTTNEVITVEADGARAALAQARQSTQWTSKSEPNTQAGKYGICEMGECDPLTATEWVNFDPRTGKPHRPIDD